MARPVRRADAAQFYTIYVSRCPAGVALCLTARAPRSALRPAHRALPYGRAPPCAHSAVGQALGASLVLVEVGVRHVERLTRLQSPDELAALHALLNAARGTPRARRCTPAADAVARELAADDEAQPPAQRGDDERAASSCVRAPMSATAAPPAVGRHREQRVHVGRGPRKEASPCAPSKPVSPNSAAGRGWRWCRARCTAGPPRAPPSGTPRYYLWARSAARRRSAPRAGAGTVRRPIAAEDGLNLKEQRCMGSRGPAVEVPAVAAQGRPGVYPQTSFLRARARGVLLRVGRAGGVELQGGSRWMLTSYPVATSSHGSRCRLLRRTTSSKFNKRDPCGPFAHSRTMSRLDSDCAPPRTLAQELAERLKHVEDGSGRVPEERSRV